jgi:hypothetical protein
VRYAGRAAHPTETGMGDMAQLLAGFAPFEVDVGGIRITGRTAGTGPPVLLLHGFPQTHVMWHHVARGDRPDAQRT